MFGWWMGYWASFPLLISPRVTGSVLSPRANGSRGSESRAENSSLQPVFPSWAVCGHWMERNLLTEEQTSLPRRGLLPHRGTVATTPQGQPGAFLCQEQAADLFFCPSVAPAAWTPDFCMPRRGTSTRKATQTGAELHEALLGIITSKSLVLLPGTAAIAV